MAAEREELGSGRAEDQECSRVAREPAVGDRIRVFWTEEVSECTEFGFGARWSLGSVDAHSFILSPCSVTKSIYPARSRRRHGP